MVSVGKTTTHKREALRDGTMIKRRMAAGMLNADRSFRPMKGLQGHAYLGGLPSLATPKVSHPHAKRRRSHSDPGRHHLSTMIGAAPGPIHKGCSEWSFNAVSEIRPRL